MNPFTHTIWRAIDLEQNMHVFFLVKLEGEWHMWHKMKLPDNHNPCSLSCTGWDVQSPGWVMPTGMSEEAALTIMNKYINFKTCLYSGIEYDKDYSIDRAITKMQQVTLKTEDTQRVADIFDWLESTKFATIEPLPVQLK